MWVKNCDSLELPDTLRKDLDAFIDNVYQMIEDADKVYDEDGIIQGRTLLLIDCLMNKFLIRMTNASDVGKQVQAMNAIKMLCATIKLGSSNNRRTMYN